MCSGGAGYARSFLVLLLTKIFLEKVKLFYTNYLLTTAEPDRISGPWSGATNLNDCLLCGARTVSTVCSNCKSGNETKRGYSRICLPDYEEMTLKERASTVITAGPFQYRLPRSRSGRPAKQKDFGRTIPCPGCGKKANLESPCFNLTTGRVMQFISCPACKLRKDRLDATSQPSVQAQ